MGAAAMSVELTRSVVEDLAKGERDQFLWDSKVTGFGVKVTPAGRRVYILQYRMPGEGSKVSPRRYTIGVHGSPAAPTVQQARKQAITLLGLVHNGDDPQEEKRAAAHDAASEAKTMAEAIEHWLAESKGPKKKPWRPATAKEWRRIMDVDVLPRLGKRSIASIVGRDVTALIDEIATRAPVHA